MLGGEDSEPFDFFKVCIIRGFLEARKHMHRVSLLVEIMLQVVAATSLSALTRCLRWHRVQWTCPVF